jgi:O-acetylhomoserine/O-acetylserine sulfhydrylase-like pyridoxal-dependent enzyme
MNRMRIIGSRKISDASDSDAYAPKRTAVVGGTSTLGRKMSILGDCARRRRDGVFRVSVGLEHIEDLLHDLDRALG